MKNNNVTFNELYIAWIKKYIFGIASPSTIRFGYKYRFDYLIAEMRKRQNDHQV